MHGLSVSCLKNGDLPKSPLPPIGSPCAIGRHDFNSESRLVRVSGAAVALSPAIHRGTVMTLPRRRFLHLAAGAAALPAVSRIARAQAYPARPVTVIVPFPAGGPADTVARIISERMRTTLGQPIIIENVAGANGSLGVGRAVRAAADG